MSSTHPILPRPLPTPLTLSEIADRIGGTVTGDGGRPVDRICHPSAAARPTDLALAMQKDSLAALGRSAAHMAVIAEGAETPALEAQIAITRPRFALAQLSALFAQPGWPPEGVHPSTVVDPGARIGDGVRIGPFCLIEAGAEIGDGVILVGQVTVGAGARLGAGTILQAGVRIGHDVTIGKGCLVHQNAVIGSDGFSFTTPEPGSVESVRAGGAVTATNTAIARIHSLGTVVLGDAVEIGAATTIDRATLEATTIGSGTKIDNLVQIAHNVRIGTNCMFAAQVGIAGSTVIGDRVVLGGKVGIADHLTIGDDVVVLGGSGVGSDIPAKGVYVGYPARPRDQMARTLMDMGRVGRLIADFGALTRRVAALEKR